MLIVENGPILVRSDPLIKRALDAYFSENNRQQKGKWHFILTGGIRTHTDNSKVIRFNTFCSGKIVPKPML